MKIYSTKTVYEAALERINYLFDEFENVIVGFSGGKDSVVTLELVLQVARERNRLPQKVMFLDQEAEWQATIDLVEDVMTRTEVEPLWLQVPIQIFNATSTIDQWLMCWEEGVEWMREKHPLSIKENIYGTKRFAEMFTAFINQMYPNSSAIYISGVRCEESPTRAVALTHSPTYKHITWGKVLNKTKGHYTFYPLYDWSYTDIWKAIFDNKWNYNKLYDYQYMQGQNIHEMRVSNVHHETAVGSLFILQEIEKETYNKLCKRISGIETAAHTGKADWNVKDLPYMFKDWKEYWDYLLDKIIKPEQMEIYQHKFAQMDKKYEKLADMTVLYKQEVQAMVFNDFHFTKITNWERRPETHTFRKFHKGLDKAEFIEKTMNNKLIADGDKTQRSGR